MERGQWIDLLSRQADGLVAGTDRSAALLSGAPLEDRASLDRLFDTARRLQRALVSQYPRREARPAFVAELRAQLAAPRPANGHRKLPDRRTLLWFAAGAGGVISAAGLGFLAYKAIENGISGIIAARAARPALSKAHPAR